MGVNYRKGGLVNIKKLKSFRLNTNCLVLRTLDLKFSWCVKWFSEMYTAIEFSLFYLYDNLG